MNIPSHSAYRPTRLPQVFFGAGKVKLFSDFDGTYFPAEHKTLSQAAGKQQISGLETYFAQVGRFLERAKSGFRFTVTTGRNLCEFKSILNHCQRLGLRMPLPDSVITKNGADEYLKSGVDEEFYRSGANPFREANDTKRQALKDSVGWDGPRIREKLLEALRQSGFKEIRQDGTTNAAEDYGVDSTQYHVQDWYNGHPSYISPWTTVLRQDGDLKFFIGLPKDMQARRDRRQAQKVLQEKIERDLRAICRERDDQPGFSIKVQAHDAEYCYHPSITIVPNINGQALTKVYDTQQAVADAAQNQDLVITAGDGSNDFEMLNPARYVHLSPALERENQRTHFTDEPKEFLKILENNSALKSQFDQLPFLGVVIERHGQLPPDLKKLVDAYSSGSHPKILKVQEGQLFEGVAKAIQAYQALNPKFSEAMDPGIQESIVALQN